MPSAESVPPPSGSVPASTPALHATAPRTAAKAVRRSVDRMRHGEFARGDGPSSNLGLKFLNSAAVSMTGYLRPRETFKLTAVGGGPVGALPRGGPLRTTRCPRFAAG